ncbi:Rubredoxin-NAD(+) reductase [hydrothermal vent metagenome]|uniref:Rubredoxin-NAD(+) reductase n=1 Tax=hydrothermal vent metagenome TaxID=652676 RepID=A0A3B0ZJ29_9ZZZZ
MSDLMIIGTGIAGYSVAREYHKLKKSSKITLLTLDDGNSYSKPMLSNALAKGKSSLDLVIADNQRMGRTLDAIIKSLVEVSSINIDEKTVSYAATSLPYKQLVIATGAAPIKLKINGKAADRVLSVNDLRAYGRFRKALENNKHITLIGAGLIGCEFANDLIIGGFTVEVLDLAEQPLSLLLPKKSADFFRKSLENVGIKFHFGSSLDSLEPEDYDSEEGSMQALLDNGKRFSTDVVLSAVGLRPRIELASEAGIDTNRGIIVDQLMRTSNPNIYSLGDCCEVEGHVLPYIMPVMQASKALASTLAGEPVEVSYPAMPVVVKTPACATVVCPPPKGVEGEWQEVATDTGVTAQFFDLEKKLRGFALVGDAVAAKAELTAKLPILF